MEACRLSSQSFGLFRRVAEDVTLEENGTTYNLKTGDEVFANLVISRVSYSNVRWEPMLILMRSLIPWKSISLVPKIHISLMDLVHTRALVRRWILWPIRLSCAVSLGCRTSDVHLDHRDNWNTSLKTKSSRPICKKTGEVIGTFQRVRGLSISWLTV